MTEMNFKVKSVGLRVLEKDFSSEVFFSADLNGE